MGYDLLITRGYLVDGTGNPWFKADLGIKDGRIQAIGDLNGPAATEKIDAKGLTVTPGFIDMHSHSDFYILLNPHEESKIFQGVTTEVVGNCGSSAAPMDDRLRAYREKYMRQRLGPDFEFNWSTMSEYIESVNEKGSSFNVLPLVGHGTVRSNIIGFEDRKPSDRELRKMRNLVARSMEEGAWGLSTGLIYTPGCFGETDEIVSLAKVAAKHHGIYSSHIRGEGETLLKAVKEAIEIGEKAEIPVEISHFKASGRKYWGMTSESLKLVEEARSRGVDVTVDQYPYIASSTSLSAYLPPWVREGGNDAMLRRLRDSKTREQIKQESEVADREWDQVMVVFAEKHLDYVGKSIQDVAKIQRKNPSDAVFDLLIEEEASVSIVAFSMVEKDVRQVMKSPYMMVGTDGSAICPEGILGRGKPHPRFYGTFPRILGHYVREEKVLTLQEAVRKMTSMPAQKIGLKDRGLLREGMVADITIFNADEIQDQATFTDPHRFPRGIYYVIVRGEVVVEKNKHTGALPGRALRKTDYVHHLSRRC